jgi:hypothetical protein
MFAYYIDDLTEAQVMVGRASRPPTELISQPRRLRHQATALSTYLANINRIGSYSSSSTATSGRVYHRGGAPQVTPLVM